MGYKVFEPLASPVDKQKHLYFIKGARGANAKAVITHEGVVVLAGSEVADTTVPSMAPAFIKHRDRLIAQGVIARTDGKLLFAKDHLFSSPSAAAAVVMGRNANGRQELKDKEGVALKDREDGGEE